MPNKFTPPTLAEVVYQYLSLLHQPARQKDFESLDSLFQKAIIRASNADDIRAALKLDTGCLLPVQMKSPIYERLLALEGRSVRLLREYAQAMYEFGPEFKPYADSLWDEANALEEKARD